MFKIVLISLAVFVAGLFALAYFRPSDYRVERTTTINAPPATIYARVNDLHKFQEWNPWAKVDPTARNTFSGPESGPGAAVEWIGNSAVGEGTMTIIENRPNELVRLRLDFRKPMKGTSVAEFTFTPNGNGTVVMWSMSGKNKLPSKVMCLFMNMDKMIGDQFQKGLADLKALSEAPPAR